MLEGLGFRLDKKIDDNYSALETRIDGTNDKIQETKKSISDFRSLHETTLEEFKLVKKEFGENNEMFTVSLRKMAKDKR